MRIQVGEPVFPIAHDEVAEQGEQLHLFALLPLARAEPEVEVLDLNVDLLFFDLITHRVQAAKLDANGEFSVGDIDIGEAWWQLYPAVCVDRLPLQRPAVSAGLFLYEFVHAVME